MDCTRDSIFWRALYGTFSVKLKICSWFFFARERRKNGLILSANARQEAVTRFAYPVVAKQYLKAYQTVLSAHSSHEGVTVQKCFRCNCHCVNSRSQWAHDVRLQRIPTTGS